MIDMILQDITAAGQEVRGIFHPLHVENVSRVDYMIKVVRKESK